jgi:hypothetical protein
LVVGLTDPLIAAASIGNVRACVKLLDLGAKIEGNGRWSPLEEALYWGNGACVTLLLERGAAVANLRTAAALGRREEIARCFDDRGALMAAAGTVAWPWFHMPIPEAVRRDPKQILGNALVYAPFFSSGETRTTLGNICPHCGQRVWSLESYSSATGTSLTGNLFRELADRAFISFINRHEAFLSSS